MLRGMRLCAVAILIAASAVAAAASEEGAAEETRICPGCGAEIPASAVFCPYCHRYLPDAKVGGETRPRVREVKQGRGTASGRRWFSGAVVGSFMTGSESTTASAILASFGFRTSDSFAIGPGVGFQNYENATSIPIFLSMRYNFSPGQVSPIGYGRVGYNKATFKEIGYPFTGEEDPSGMFFGVGGGVDVVTAAGFGLTLEVGGRVEVTYRYIVYIYPGGRVSPVEKRQETLGLIRLGMGAVF
jgi:hypothetical protein